MKMTKMTSKILASSLVILTTLGLAGCANSAQAPTSKQTATATKVSKNAVKESTSSQASTSDLSSSASASAESAATSSTTPASSPALQATSTNQPATTSSSAVVSSASQTTNNATPSTQDKQEVLASFVQASGVQQKGNRYYVAPSTQDSSNYQIEVRNNQGGDPNVAHLTGLYQYDPSTNQIQQMNPITGNFDK